MIRTRFSLILIAATLIHVTTSHQNDASLSLPNQHYQDDDAEIFVFRGDYTPPSPPPPPPAPHPPSLTCEEGLRGTGSLNAICQLSTSIYFTNDVYIEGNGTLSILDGVVLACPFNSCLIVINMTKNFSLGENSTILGGTVWILAYNVSLGEGSLVNVTGLGGDPPAQTSGTPPGIQGSGGGHGGRGASCVLDNTKLVDDEWGGDPYAWAELDRPFSYGSRGGTTSEEEWFGGGGGGRIRFEVTNFVSLDGNLMADGGDGGVKGGGGSGGSIYILAHRM